MANELLNVIITAEDRAGSVLSGLGNIAGGILTAGLAVAAAGAAALAGGLAFSISEAMEAEQVMAQLNAVLRSTQGVAGVTSAMATDLADSLSEVTTFSDDAILSAESLLLTFTAIGKDAFPWATKAALNMSVTFGQDLKASVIQLGKALQDPIAGISALSRIGVQFTEEQKEQIKVLTESGKLWQAQAIILEEVDRQTAGSARAAGQTAAGQWEIFKNSLSNVAEEIGTRLLPLVGDLMSKVFPIVIEKAKAFADIINRVTGALFESTTPAASLKEVLADYFPADWLLTINAIIDGVFNMAAAFELGGGGLLGLKNALFSIAPEAEPLITAFFNIIDALQNSKNPLKDIQHDLMKLLPPELQDAVRQVIKAVQDMIAAWQEVWPEIEPILKDLGEGAGKSLLNSLVNSLIFLSGVILALADIWRHVGPEIVATFAFLVKAFLTGLEFITFSFRVFGEFLKAVVTGDFKKFDVEAQKAFKSLIDSINKMFDKDAFVQMARDAIDGFIRGLASMWSKLKSEITTGFGDAVGALKALLGIASPSKVFMEMGRNLTAGLAMGIEGGLNMPKLAMAGMAGGLTGAVSGGGAITNQRMMAFYGNVTFAIQGDHLTLEDIANQVFTQMRTA